MANEKRLIDANALIDWLTKPTGFRCNCEDCPDIDCLHCVIEDAIKTAPTVDAVEVVRCKDCRSCEMCYPEKQLDKEATQAWICNRYKRFTKPDDFCSYGERREGE